MAGEQRVVGRVIGEAAGIDLDIVEAPFLEIQPNVLVDMTVQPDLALGAGAAWKRRRMEVERLRAGVAAKVGVDSGLQPHPMDPVDERPEAGAFAAADSRAREGRGADLQPAVDGSALFPPAVVDVDIDIAERSKPGVDQRLRGADHLGLVDVGAEGVPRVPAHRRDPRGAAAVGGPAGGRRKRVGGRLRAG